MASGECVSEQRRERRAIKNAFVSLHLALVRNALSYA